MPSSTAKTALTRIAGNVYRLRTRQSLTQEKLAELAGLDPRFLQRVERAKTNIGVVALAGLADALGVPLAALFREAELPPLTRGRPPAKKRRPMQ